ncbi:hypothetical protein D3C72_2195380 [compost metagenome]
MLVVINAHAQVDFVGTGIGVECFVEAQDGVARSHFDGRKQTHDAAARRRKVRMGATRHDVR